MMHGESEKTHQGYQCIMQIKIFTRNVYLTFIKYGLIGIGLVQGTVPCTTPYQSLFVCQMTL